MRESAVMGIPHPDSKEYDRMVDFMREDLRTGMGLTKIIESARKAVEESGRNFDEEFAKWLKKQGKGVIVWPR